VNAKDKIYKLETLYEGLDMPWDIDFLPNGDFLVSELTGNLKIYSPSLKTLITVSNVPSVLARSQGGLSDVELHPDFELNNLIYLSYSIRTKEGNTLRVSRAKLHENTLIDLETIHDCTSLQKNISSLWRKIVIFK
jgi:glucose/arabinose dehydrogenase